MKIEDKLTESVLKGVKELYGVEVPAKMVQLQKTKKEFEGHLTLVVFPFLKASKKGPEQTAQEIGEYLKRNEPAIASFNVIKGFLNLTIASPVWIGMLDRIDADAQWGIRKADENAPLVMIEYSSPNTNKPLHLGHVRNNLLGWSLAQIMQANGNRVVKTNIVNDRGIHICKSMLAWLKYGNGETPESSGKKGDHLIGDYYVAFDKHYREEVKELKEKFVSEGMTDEEAEKKAKDEAPLIKEAHEMLVGVDVGQQRQPRLRRHREVQETLYDVVRGHGLLVFHEPAAYVLSRFLRLLARRLEQGEHHQRQVSFKLALRLLQLYHLLGHFLSVESLHCGLCRAAYLGFDVHFLLP